MDRDAVARAGRRAQAEEALAFEREREAALREQVEALVLEEAGADVDAAAFAELADDDVERVRAALGEVAILVEEDDDPFDDEPYVTFDDPDDEPAEDEVGRLGAEIDDSRRTQAALERYIAALERPSAAEAG